MVAKGENAVPPRTRGQPPPARSAGHQEAALFSTRIPTRRRMNCRDFTECLHAYPLGNLTSGERAEFQKHLAECPWCVVYPDSYRKTIQLEHVALAAPEDAPPPGDAPEELIQAILPARPRS